MNHIHLLNVRRDGARFSINSLFHYNNFKVLPFDAARSLEAQASEWLVQNGFTALSYGATPKGAIIGVAEFCPLPTKEPVAAPPVATETIEDKLALLRARIALVDTLQGRRVEKAIEFGEACGWDARTSVLAIREIDEKNRIEREAKLARAAERRLDEMDAAQSKAQHKSEQQRRVAAGEKLIEPICCPSQPYFVADYQDAWKYDMCPFCHAPLPSDEPEDEEIEEVCCPEDFEQEPDDSQFDDAPTSAEPSFEQVARSNWWYHGNDAGEQF